MNDKGIANSKNERLYFTDFIFTGGEYKQQFVKFFYAQGKKDLKKKIQDYLIDYYSKRNISTVYGDVFINVMVEMSSEYIGWMIKNYINNNQKGSKAEDISI